MSLPPLRLNRKLEHRLWGGQRLAAWLNLPRPWPEDLAESWQVYDTNLVTNGALAGRSLAELVREYGEGLVGTISPRRYGLDFPLLAKYLDANDSLSIQVHPDDAYAHTVEAHTGFHGKTEAWYILQAEPGSRLIYGLDRRYDRGDVQRALDDGTLEGMLNYVEVSAGDVVFVPAGTLHAITAGIMLFEIQQKSDLTYRLYDFGRRDSTGRLRELHADKALDVLDYDRPCQTKAPSLALGAGHELLVACPYFALEKLRCDAGLLWATRHTSFEIWSVVEGEATVAGEVLVTGDSVVLPADLGPYRIAPAGTATLLRCYVPDLDADLVEPLRRAGYKPEQVVQTIMSA